MVIPEDAAQYPITPQKVVKFDDKNKELKTWETHIVKCEAWGFNGPIHPQNTEWNYVEQAKARAGKPYRSHP